MATRRRRLSRFAKWLTTTHAVRWHRFHKTVGNGAVYQSRFKSVPIELGPHLFWAWRYVERNALRANLVTRAEDWPWNSLGRRVRGQRPEWLNDGPVPLPSDWAEVVNIPQTTAELEAFRLRANLGQPFGREGWMTNSTPAKGRPQLRKAKKEGLTP